MGVKKENVYFLGYGDNLNNSKKRHIFYAQKKVAEAPSGYKETYGTRERTIESFTRFGKHHSYLKRKLLADLQNVILDIGAGVITIDYGARSCRP